MRASSPPRPIGAKSTAAPANGFHANAGKCFRYQLWHHQCESIEQTYLEMLKLGCKAQDARSILPNSLKTEIIVTANIREWRHIFNMRTSKFAHWEIRAVMLNLLKYCKENIPLIFDDFEFFTNKETNQQYAMQLPSKSVLKDLLEHCKEKYGVTYEMP